MKMEENNIPTPHGSIIQNCEYPFQSVGHSISRCMWHVLSAYVRENPGLQQLNVNIYSIPIKMKYIWNSKCCFKYLYSWSTKLLYLLVIYSLSKCFEYIFQRDKEIFFWQLWLIDHKKITIYSRHNFYLIKRPEFQPLCRYPVSTMH